MEIRHINFLNFVLLILLLIPALTCSNWEHVNYLWGGATGACVALFLNVGGWMLNSRKYLRIVYSAFFIKSLRLSCSYLYKIKIDDSYLLIRSRKHGKFQPVGGNFKRNQCSHGFLQKIEIQKDECFTNGGRSTDDLRLFIKGCDLQKYLKWYNAPNKQREVSYDREFHEELVEPGYLSPELFPFPRIDFKKQVITPVHYSKYLKCKEVHIYDIIELMPTTEQEEFLRQLRDKGNTAELIWVDANTMITEGYEQASKSSQHSITDHSKEILV